VRTTPFGVASFAHNNMNGINTTRNVLKNILIIVRIILFPGYSSSGA
jgi:hypothetical protein